MKHKIIPDMTDKELIDEYYDQHAEMVVAQMDASTKREKFEMLREECIQRKLRVKKGRSWGWSKDAEERYKVRDENESESDTGKQE
jgi:hypothetical protein